MLNSPAMLPAFNGAKTSGLYFGLAIWKCVPVPRFNPENKLHARLAGLSCKARIASAKAYESERARGNLGTNWSASRTIQKALAESGISGQIDDLCRAVIDEYYRSVAHKPYWK